MNKFVAVRRIYRCLSLTLIAGTTGTSCRLMHMTLPYDPAEAGVDVTGSDQESPVDADTPTDAESCGLACDVNDNCQPPFCTNADVAESSPVDAFDSDGLDVFDADAGNEDASASDAPISDSPSADVTVNYRTEPRDTYDLLEHGGGAGVAYLLACGSGTVAVGLSGRSGTLIDAVGLRCASLRTDGSTEDAVTETAQVGSTTGGIAFSDRCPSGHVIVGLQGGAYADGIHQLGAVCAPLREWVAAGTLGATLPIHGTNIRTPFRDLCPVGYVLNKLSGVYTYINTVQGHCVRILP